MHSIRQSASVYLFIGGLLHMAVLAVGDTKIEKINRVLALT